jgi:predicted solute-binding protein
LFIDAKFQLPLIDILQNNWKSIEIRRYFNDNLLLNGQVSVAIVSRFETIQNNFVEIFFL